MSEQNPGNRQPIVMSREQPQVDDLGLFIPSTGSGVLLLGAFDARSKHRANVVPLAAG